MNKVYNIKITTLTPVHIGDGNTMSGLNYFCYQQVEKGEKTSFLYVFDIENLTNLFDDKDKKWYIQKIKKWDILEISKYVYDLFSREDYKNKLLSMKGIQKIKITNTFYNHWKNKILWVWWQSKGKNREKRQNEKKHQQSQMTVQTFINSLWRYYIPWSSLKWVLRTVLSNEKIEYNSKNHKVEKDPFKKLIVQDSEFFWFQDVIIIDSLARMWKDTRKNKQGDWQFAEFLQVWKTTNSKIIIKEFLDEKELEKIDFSQKNICQKANNYLKQKIEKYIWEIDELKKHSDLKVDKVESIKKKQKLETVKSEFQKILDQINTCKENECILALWFGTGYWFKMLQDKKERHPWRPNHLIDPNINIPRTNRTTNLQNLWFTKLTFTS